MLKDYELKKIFDAAFRSESKNFQADWKLKENEQGWRENRISAEVIKFLNCLSKEGVWNSASEQFQQEAKKIWNRLANSGKLSELGQQFPFWQKAVQVLKIPVL